MNPSKKKVNFSDTEVSPSSTTAQTQSWSSYLHVAAPLRFPFQQGIQDSPAGLLSSRVIPTHHIVGRPDSLEKLNINILTIAVVGDVAQVQIHREAWGYRGGLGRFCGAWSFSKQRQSRGHSNVNKPVPNTPSPLHPLSLPTNSQAGPLEHTKRCPYVHLLYPSNQ